jgi:two-component system, OmpR family, response regulator QseB
MQVLLVEDDLQLGSALHRALELQAFDSVWVRRLADARAQADYAAFAAVVLDINLPDGEGFALLDWLRTSGKHVPVLIMTARESLDDRLRGLDAGADDYLVKPFAVSEMIARLRAILRRSAGFSSRDWIVGALAIDTEQRSATLYGVGIELTPIEYRLLIALARRATRNVSRESLRNTVWGPDEGATDAALDFHVHALRRKLGAERIVTARGIGFRLESL